MSPRRFAGILGLPVIVLLSRGRRVRRSAAVLSLFVLITLLGNAMVCGVLSNPHDRYQSRLVWLAPLALAVARRDASAGPGSTKPAFPP